MSIEVIEVNGKNKFLNYDKFEIDIRNELSVTCKDAKVFILNNFPIAISSEANIDLLLIIAVQNVTGNFYKIKRNKRDVYLYNQVIPIKIVTDYDEKKISLEKEGLVTDSEFINYADEITSLKFGLSKYLSQKCLLTSENVYVNPIIYIKNDSNIVVDNYILSKEFNVSALFKYFRESSLDLFLSYNSWKDETGYNSLNEDIGNVIEQASKDSNTGYITKNKIERISKKLLKSKAVFNDLNQRLICISGKAGTGKSSELLLLLQCCRKKGGNALLLTYNHLLVNELSRIVKLSTDALLIESDNKIGIVSISTLQSFFFRLSKSLGVLAILSESRINELLGILKIRMRKLYDYIKVDIVNSSEIDCNKLKEKVYNSKHLDLGIKDLGMDFFKMLDSKYKPKSKDFIKYSKEFYEKRETALKKQLYKQVFLADYYNVLENIISILRNSDEYFENNSIDTKGELLSSLIKSDKYYEVVEGRRTIKQSGYKEYKNRSIGGYRRGQTIFIDEGQDCHRIERDIIFLIFGHKNVVVADGGKEQLIRHKELCNWGVFNNQKIDLKKSVIRNRSYRVKKSLLNFCNYVANRYDIALNLESNDSEDKGELIIDYRRKQSEKQINNLFDYLNTKGAVNNCSPIERVLMLSNATSLKLKESTADRNMEETHSSLKVNEYNNISISKTYRRDVPYYLSAVRKNHKVWDGTAQNKTELLIPVSEDFRHIYYESCRGLESWSVVCQDIDVFFENKRLDPEAEKFLMDDVFLHQDVEKRKSMYAATWVLMALTRVIDTLCIQIDDSESEFGAIVKDYIDSSPENTRVVR